MKRVDRFFISLALPLSLIASSGKSEASPKSVAQFFPGAPALDLAGGIKPRSSAEYASLLNCRNSSTPATTCTPGPARLYDLATATGLVDSFDHVNRCIAMIAGNERVIGPPILDAAAGTVDCPPAGPGEIAVLHLLACSEAATGASCHLATLCFTDGDGVGACTRDYPREDYPLRPLN